MAESEVNGFQGGPLAIANPDRRLLEGPQYLDALVCSNSERYIAVEHLDEHGKIERLNYQLLQQAAQNITHHILQSRCKSTRSNTIIPVVIPQGPLLYLSYLGVLRAGAAFCPILSDTPDERLQFILHDVRAELALCVPSMIERLKRLSPSMTCISVTRESCYGQLQDNTYTFERHRKSSDIAYVMYTSGSTGRPKGVPVSHRAVTQSLLAHGEHIPTFERFFQFAAPTFDVSIFEIFFPWFREATLISCERETTLTDLCGILRRLDVDAVEMTPTVVSTLLRKRDAVPKLKLLLTIGEMLNSHIIQEFGQSKSQAGILYAMYGPTEAAIHCTIVPNMETSSSIHNIGKPLSTVTAFILTESDDMDDVRVCIRGQSGELAVAGQLADGYLNRLSQTKLAFVNTSKYGTLYRTGDRATMLADGTLQISGRMSNGQVKLRGQRVELGEIEAVALQVVGVDLAVATVMQDTLALFCSGQPNIESARIEARCKAWLPRHMRPGYVIMLPEGMPCLPSGKVDRRCLEEVFQQRFTTASSIGTSTHGLAASWIRDVFLEELGTMIEDHHTLRLSGLSSIRAIKIASKLRQRYQKISISDVLEADTITHLVTILESQDKEVDEDEEAAISNAEDEQYLEILTLAQEQWRISGRGKIVQAFPCSRMQSSMLAETSRDPALNFNKILLTTNSLIKFSTVLEAFMEVAARNPILRSAFEPTGDPGTPFVQLIKPGLSFETTPSMFCPLSISQGKNDRELVVTIHHALYDGWSWDLIVKDLNTWLLNQTLPGRPSFHTFSRLVAQRATDNHEHNLTEWTELLQGVEFPGFPSLCYTSPLEAGRDYHSTDSSISRKHLSTMASDLSVNMAAIVHAALSLVLAKYFDTETVVTGLVLSGREPVMLDVGEIIGPCLTTVPLLVKLSEGFTVQILIQQVYQQYIESLRRSLTPLSEIGKALSLSQDTRLFDVLFVWQESPHPGDPDADAVVTTATYDCLEYALVVEIESKGDFFSLKTNFDTAKLSLDQVDCFHSQLDALIERFARGPEIALENIWEAMPPKVLSLSQSQAQQPPEDLTSMLLRVFSQFPDRTAIDFVEDFDPVRKQLVRKVITYKDLHIRASNIAEKLVNQHKLKGNDIVAICCEKSPDLYSVICATILAGIAYLCVDPNTPDNRVRDILREARPRVFVSDKPCNNFLQDDHVDCSKLHLEELVTLEDGCAKTRDRNSKGSDLAYAVFTSGSTGVPKGVLLTRENLASNLYHLSSIYPFSDTSRLLQSCSQAFDVSVFEIFWTWCCGLTLCSSTNDILFRDVETFIDALDITHLSMTPSVAALVNPSNVPKVEFLVCAGEPMSARVYELWSGRGLQQGYGPSETTNICNIRHYANGRALINNVGPPFPNTSIFVCAKLLSHREEEKLSTSDFKILPRGAVGELWIGGQQVGRGYTNPELTEKSYLDHPTFGRLFKSGDFGRMLPDESLLIIGREDDQVKIRGQRVELKEIDLALRQSNNIADSFTTIMQCGNGRQKLVTFWVHKEKSPKMIKALIGQLYDMLRENLPSYMLPESLIPISDLPLTSQSKIDRRALLARYHNLEQGQLDDFSSIDTRSDGRDVLSKTQQIVVDVLADVVQMPMSSINLHRSFLNYGIDSIRAIAFTRRLRDAGVAMIEVSTILKYPTVHRLVSALEKLEARDAGVKYDVLTEAIPSPLRRYVNSELKVRGLKGTKILPCTPLQVGMLSAYDISTNGAYQNHLVYHLKEDPLLIKKAWKAMVAKIDLLRTMFSVTQDAEYPFVQIVLEDHDLPWADLEGNGSEPVVSPFEMPPYLLRLKSCTSHMELHLFIHHALYDAESMAHLQNDIETICLGGTVMDRPKFSRYLEFMLNMDEKDSGKFWKLILRDMTPSLLAGSEPQLQNIHRVQITRTKQNVIAWTTISACAKEMAATPLNIFQTALARFLSVYTAAVDICFGTVFSGRNIDVPNADQIIGPCFNTLPTRVHFRASHTKRDVCRQFHSYNVSVLPYQATSLRDLQRTYGVPGSPLFDILLLFHSVAPHRNNKVWTLAEENGSMAFPFILEVQFDALRDTVHLYLHSNTSSEPPFLDDLLDRFTELVADTVETFHLPILGNSLPHGDDINRSSNVPNSHIHINGRLDIMSDTSVSRQVVGMLKSTTKKNFPTISPNTTIFHLGLDSISTVQLAARLREEGFNVSAGELLDKPRIADIVKICEQRRGMRAPEQEVFDLDAFDRDHRRNVLRRLGNHDGRVTAVWPCTATQLGILSEHLQSGGNRYYNSVRLHLGTGVDIALLCEKFQELIEIHEMLRVGFVELDRADMPYAMVLYSRTQADIRSVREDSTQDQISITPFPDISRPPWHVEILKNGHDNFVELHMLHALYDGKSLNIMLRDLSMLYQGLPVQYQASVCKALSYIVAKNEAECDMEDLLGCSKSEVHVTNFPNLNVSRNVVPSFLTVSFELAPGREAIQSRCEAQGCHIASAFQAAWAVLLSAYTGQKSIVFGSVVSGRSFDEEDLNEVAFPCINTLPIVVDTANPELSVIEQIKRANARSHKNAHIPLTRIKRACGIEGDLFDIIVVLHQPRQLGSDHPWQIESGSASAEYAISLEVTPIDEKFVLQLTFNQAVLPPEHASILLQQFKYNLCELLDLGQNDGAIYSRLHSAKPPVCSVIQPHKQCLHDLVLSAAARFPQRIALEMINLVDEGVVHRQVWTYQQIVSEASQLANLLKTHGSRTGDMIGLCCEQSAQASMALLGILIAGCTYVAIDPSSPSSRKAFIIGDASCKVLLTTSSIADTLAFEGDIKVLCIDKYQLLSEQSTIFDSAEHQPSSQDTCYCLYTSGTTGTPKGCLISHHSAVQAMNSFSRIFDGRWTEESRWLQFASYHFDVSVLEHFWSWKEGICVSIIPRDLLFEDLPGMINKVGITHLDLTPSLARLLTPESVPSLCNGVFIVGGEEVRQEIIETWGDAGCLYNFYGPSEVTIGCTVHPRVRKGVKATNIGHQWDNVGAFVFEPGTVKPVPIGAIGELCVSGVLVGKGYLNRPELTAEKFVTLDATGERVYRTGDLVRMLHDHSLEFLGRNDTQVKLRGQRLEIGEINDAILRYSTEFEDAATMVVRHPESEKPHLVAFLARKKNGKIIKTESKNLLLAEQPSISILGLRSRLADQLPNYMIPTYLIVVDFLPLTVNNKVDQKALKSTYSQTSLSEIRAQQQQYDTKTSRDPEVFSTFFDSLASYLGIEKDDIGPHDSLLQLGIDSVSAIGLARVLKKIGYANASVQLILQRPIVADLAVRCCSGSSSGSDDEKAERDEAAQNIRKFAFKHKESIQQVMQLRQKEIENIAPCTALQEGMISKMLANDSKRPPYMTKFVFRLDPSIDLDRLRNAWDALQTQLDILRTLFVATQDGFAQVVQSTTQVEALKFDFGVASVSDDPLQTIDGSFASWLESSRHLDRNRPWEAWITIRQSRNLMYMSVFMFHGLYDGISMEVLLKHLHRLYEDPRAENHAPLFYEALSHGPLLCKRDSSDFWVRRLPKIHLLDLPLAHEITEASRGVHEVQCEFMTSKIDQVCFDLGVTAQALFHAVWLLVLAQRFNLNPTIGIVLSGRSIDLEHTGEIVGPMFNTLPFDINNLSKDACVVDLIQASHRLNTDVLPYQHTSLSSIRRSLKLRSKQELFDSLFVYQIATSFEEKSQQKWVEVQTQSSIEYPLNLEIEKLDVGRYGMQILADAKYLDEDDTSNILESLKLTLGSLSELLKQKLPRCFLKDAAITRKQSLPVATDIPISTTEEAWTGEAELVREVLADLAGVDYTVIGLKSPTMFELGLDSVDALKLAARLKARGIRVPVGKILRNPTVKGIVAERNALGTPLFGAASASPFSATQSAWRERLERQVSRLDNVQMILPTTPLQQGMLLEFEHYYHTMIFSINDADMSRFLEAVLDTVRVNAILRTGFVAVDAELRGEPTFQQLIAKPMIGGRKPQISYNMRDIDELRAFVKQTRLNAEIIESTPRFYVIRLENGKSYLMLAFSHASYDAWTLQLILQNLKAVYAGSHNLKDDAHMIAEYIHGLQQAQNSPEAIHFWSRHLENIESSVVRVSRSETSFPALLREKNTKIPLEQVYTTCRRLGITLQSLTATTWALCLMMLTQQLDVNFGVIASGRTTEDVKSLVFPTFNTVVLRVHAQPQLSKSKFLQKVHALLVEMFEYQQFPLSAALDLAGMRGKGLFNTLFTFQKVPVEQADGPALLEEIDLDLGEGQFSPPYAINVEVQEKHGKLTWTVAIQEGVTSQKTLEDIFGVLDQILESLAAVDDVDVIDVRENELFICGLPPIQMQDQYKGYETGSTRSPPVAAQTASSDERDWSETEVRIRKVFAEVSGTGTTDIRKDASLYHLGLDSVSAIKISSSLRNSGLKIPVSKILRYQTIAKIASSVSEVSLVASEPARTVNSDNRDNDILWKILEPRLRAAGVPNTDVEDILPTTGGQEYMLDMWHASKGRLFYATFSFEAQRCDRAIFETAFKQLIREIPALRTRFINDSGKSYQVILGSTSGVRGPIQYQITEIDNGLVVALHIHHALYDAVSLDLIVRRLKTLCSKDRSRNTENINPAVDPRPFLDVLQFHETSAQQFWTNYLSGLGNPVNTTATFEQTRTECFVPELLSSKSIETSARGEGLSVQAIFFAAIARVYARTRYSMEGDQLDTIVIGIYLANRSLDVDNLAELITPTFNIVPLKVEIARSTAILEAARQVQVDLQEITQAEHCGVSLRDIHKWTGIRIDCYINFLRLPDTGDGILRTKTQEDGDVEIKHAEGEVREHAKALIQMNKSTSPYVDEEGVDTVGVEWCISALDVEARIDETGGMLAVGMFAPGDMLDETGMREMMEELRVELSGVEGL